MSQKQKYELSTFTNGVIGSVDESDIPDNAASYSVNVDPNAEDGVIRGIRSDTILASTSGFVNAATQKETLTVLLKPGTNLLSSQYDYRGSWFTIDTPSQNFYVWFHYGSPTTIANATGSITFSGLPADDATIQIISTLNHTVGAVTYTCKSSGYGDQTYYFQRGADGPATLANLQTAIEETHGGAISAVIDPLNTSTMTLTQNVPGPGGNSTITESDANISVVNIAGGTEGDPKGNPANNLDDRLGIEIELVESGGSQDTQATMAAKIIAALNATSGTYTDGSSKIIGNYVKATATTSTAFTIETIETFTGTGASTGALYGETNLATLPGHLLLTTAISIAASTTGTGGYFPVDDMRILSKEEDVHDLVGVDFDSSTLFLWKDIYNKSGNNGGKEVLKTNLDHKSVSSMAVRNKAIHMGMGNETGNDVQWVGHIDNKQFDQVHNGYFAENDRLTTLNDELAPLNFDKIISSPMANNKTAFDEVQSHHAEITMNTGQTLNASFYSGVIYAHGDGTINTYGKADDSAPKIGWCFEIQNTNDTSGAQLLAAKRKYYDVSSSIAAGDVFMVIDPGTDGSTSDAKVEYIGNTANEQPAFMYAFTKGSPWLFRISTTTTADASAFTNTGGSSTSTRYTSYDLTDLVKDGGIGDIAVCRSPIIGGITTGDSQWMSYGDGTHDAQHLSLQYCRYLHGCIWISDMFGALHRVLITDLDEQHHTESMQGFQKDVTLELNYSEIGRCQTDEDSGQFKQWFGAVTEAEKSNQSLFRNDYFGDHGLGSGAATVNINLTDAWGSHTWTREPVASKIVSICETWNNGISQENTAAAGTLDYYLLNDSTDGSTGAVIAKKHQTDTAYQPTHCVKWKYADHGFDLGNVLTVYNSTDTDFYGNAMVVKLYDEDWFATTGQGDAAYSGAGTSSYYSCKVWLMHQKQNESVPFKRWESYLYNFYPSTMTTAGAVECFDRTPPYSELGSMAINMVNNDGDPIDGENSWWDDFDSGQNEININKELNIMYTQATDSWLDQNDGSAADLGIDGLRVTTGLVGLACARNDGSVVSWRLNLEATHFLLGYNAGWDGSAEALSSDGYRETHPTNYTLCPWQNVGGKHKVTFIAHVKGNFKTRGQAFNSKSNDNSNKWRTQVNSGKWESIDDYMMYSLTDTGAKHNDTRRFGHYYTNGNGTTAINPDEYYDPHYLGGDAYFAGGRYKLRDKAGETSIIPNDKNYYYNQDLSYDGTKMANSQVPFSVDSNAIPMGQIGDYLYLDRKWLSCVEHLDASSDTTPQADTFSMRETVECISTEEIGQDGTENFNSKMSNSVWPFTTAYSSSSALLKDSSGKGMKGTDEGYWKHHVHSSSFKNPFEYSTTSRQMQWHVHDYPLSSASSGFGNLAGDIFYNGPGGIPTYASYNKFSYSISRYAPAYDTLRKGVVEQRKLNSGTTAGSLSPANYDVIRQSQSLYSTGWAGTGALDAKFLVSGSYNNGLDYASLITAFQPEEYATNELAEYDPYINSTRYDSSANNVYAFAHESFTANPRLLAHWIESSNYDAALDAEMVTWINGTNTADTESSKNFLGWGQLDFTAGADAPTALVITDSNLLLTTVDNFVKIDEPSATGSVVNFPANASIRYKVSLLYDGFQESPLGKYFFDKDMGSSNREALNITLKVNAATINKLSKRVTHIILYRKNSVSELYRMVKQVSLEPEFWIKSGDEWTHKFEDSKKLGSYEANTGISETIRDTSIHYQISCISNDMLFIGNCYQPKIEEEIEYKGDTKRYIFRSKPGNFSQFDWTTDYLILDTIPTAMASFAGRVYIFDRRNTYVIDPNTMTILDKFEGVGCLSSKTISVTEFGMCFADKNNVYLHDSSLPKPIGTNILSLVTYEGYSIGYQDAVTESENSTPPIEPLIFFDGASHSFIIALRGVCASTCNKNVSRAWAYNLVRNRWDYWEIPRAETIIQGRDNDLLVSDKNFIFNYKGATDYDQYRSWEFRTKKLNITNQLNSKRFHRINLQGSPCLGTITNPANKTNDDLCVYVDGEIQTLTIQNTHYVKEYSGCEFNGNIDDDDTTISIVSSISGGRNPVVGNYLMLEHEIIKVTALATSSTFVVSRGQLGTTEIAHNGSSTNIKLYNIAPRIKLPSKCKGKNIELHFKNQNGVLNALAIEFIHKKK